MAVIADGAETARDVAARAHRLRPVDAVVLGYAAATSLVALLRIGVLPRCGWVLLLNVLMALLVLLLTRRTLGPFGGVVREIYPLLLLPLLYSALGVLNGGGRLPVHDLLVQRWEAALFGGQPSRDWWRADPSRLWSTVLHAAYFSYYFIIAIPAGLLLAWRDRPGLRRFVLAVVATFVFCFLCFVLFPVAGPYYAFPRPDAAFLDNPAARLVYATLARGSSYGAAFPSSHVAASVAATFSAWAASRRLGVLVAVPAALLTVGVVYCQMHYVVDALAGLAVGSGFGLAVARRT
ncbi:MAG TPA: phosphatase PAP2 family protein [Gemmatimonadales bacterium]|nr:phosphatase PAP2 family protein [Gemmatimonadales bacterium]